MTGIVDQLANLHAGLAQVRAALGGMPRVPRMQWGTVTTLSPLTVTLDGDTAPCGVSWSDVPVWVGARVRVQVQGQDRWIVANTAALPAAQYSAVGPSEAITNGYPFANTPTLIRCSLTFPAPAYVQIDYGARLTASTPDLTAGVQLSGATVVDAGGGAAGPALAVLWAGSVGTSNTQMSRAVLCNAGTTLFTLQAFGSGTNSINYGSVRATPVRWA